MTDQHQDPRVSLAEDRTEMANFRTSLALDRTTLAWVRTTLSMSSFGLGIVGFFRALRRESTTPDSIRHHQAAIHFGVALVLLGVIATILVAIWHHRGRPQTPIRPDTQSDALAAQHHHLLPP